jgi:hypothetical protein
LRRMKKGRNENIPDFSAAAPALEALFEMSLAAYPAFFISLLMLLLATELALDKLLLAWLNADS